jgi:hypothetical protein
MSELDVQLPGAFGECSCLFYLLLSFHSIVSPGHNTGFIYYKLKIFHIPCNRQVSDWMQIFLINNIFGFRRVVCTRFISIISSVFLWDKFVCFVRKSCMFWTQSKDFVFLQIKRRLLKCFLL